MAEKSSSNTAAKLTASSACHAESHRKMEVLTKTTRSALPRSTRLPTWKLPSTKLAKEVFHYFIN